MSLYRPQIRWLDPAGRRWHHHPKNAVTHVVMTRMIGGKRWHTDSYHESEEAAETRRQRVPGVNEAVVIAVTRPTARG